MSARMPAKGVTIPRVKVDRRAPAVHLPFVQPCRKSVHFVQDVPSGSGPSLRMHLLTGCQTAGMLCGMLCGRWRPRSLRCCSDRGGCSGRGGRCLPHGVSQCHCASGLGSRGGGRRVFPVASRRVHGAIGVTASRAAGHVPNTRTAGAARCETHRFLSLFPGLKPSERPLLRCAVPRVACTSLAARSAAMPMSSVHKMHGAARRPTGEAACAALGACPEESECLYGSLFSAPIAGVRLRYCRCTKSSPRKDKA